VCLKLMPKFFCTGLLSFLLLSCRGFDEPHSIPTGIDPAAERAVLDVIAKNLTVEERDNVFRDDGEGFQINAANYSARGTSLISGGWWEVDGDNNIVIEGPLKGQSVWGRGPTPGKNYMLVVGKDIGDIMPISRYYHGPFLDYTLDIARPGRYQLELYWTGQGPYTDSIYAYFLDPDGKVFTRHGPSFFFFTAVRVDGPGTGMG